MDFVRDVAGGSFALNCGARGEDQFAALGGVVGVIGEGEARPKVGKAKLVGADAVYRGEGAVEDVVDAVPGAGPFDCRDVRGLLDNADETMRAGGAGTEGARVDVGDVVTQRAQTECLFEGVDGVREGVRVKVRRAENVKGVALGGLGADAGQLAKFFNEACHGRREA